MDKDKIRLIIKDLDQISNKYGTDNFYLAMYILLRYGTFTFEDTITNSKLEKIFEVIRKQGTLYDAELNHKIDKILNADD